MKKGVHAALSVVLALGFIVPTASAKEPIADDASVTNAAPVMETLAADAREQETSAVAEPVEDASESGIENAGAEESAFESASKEPSSDIRVQVNGKLVEFPDAQPYIDPVTNRTMVPVRFVSEALGATVTWDPVKQKVRIVKDGKVAVLIVGNKKVDVHNRTFYMDATPVLREGRTYVPLRFVSEAFDQDVTWDAGERMVIITPRPVLPERTDSKLLPRNLAAEAAMVSFVNSIQVKDGYVEAIMPKTPEGYRLKMDYYDESDGVWGNRDFDVIKLQDKYKAGEKIKIQIHGKGGFFSMAIYEGAKGVGSVSVRVPSLETTWFNEREL